MALMLHGWMAEEASALLLYGNACKILKFGLRPIGSTGRVITSRYLSEQWLLLIYLLTSTILNPVDVERKNIALICEYAVLAKN